MSLIASNPLVRTLTATAVAGALALAQGASFAAQTDKGEGSQASSQQQEQLTDREVVAHYLGWDDPDMARVAVHGGRALLRDLRAAHAAVEQGKLGTARPDLTAAKDFAEALQLMIPYTVVVDRIRNAKNELLSSTSGLIVDDLLPIYANLDEMAEFAPELAHKAKTKLDEAVKQMHKGEKKKAAAKLDEVAADISSTAVYLPVLYVENQVKVARRALDQEKPDTAVARGAIDNALASLVHTTVNMHLFPEEKGAVRTAPAQSGEQAKKAGS
jgi:hypothetical protein